MDFHLIDLETAKCSNIDKCILMQEALQLKLENFACMLLFVETMAIKD